MGVLRAIFAITVVFAHSWPGGMMFVGGQLAVQLFYVTSGFLISYVLLEGKAYSHVGSFYVNRYLRLYPIYLFVAILTVVALSQGKNHAVFDIYESAPLSATLLLIFSNAFMFFQDWILFFEIKDGRLIFTPDFRASDVTLMSGLLVPQAWTLGLELMFYAIAPFVLPRRKLILFLLAGSIALRLFLLQIGLGTTDPWTYRFFPAELALFLLGALSHQILLPLYQKIPDKRLARCSEIATGFLVFVSLVYYLVPVPQLYKGLALIMAFVALMPLTFIFQSRHRFDNWVGSLSYPIYIGHVLVIWIVSYLAKSLQIDDRIYVSLVCVVVSVVFAILLELFIGRPVEKLRARFRAA